jgi:hypothetical protein
MIKCLECGFESSRLQWTHFKYKCTGRFQNGTEYLKAYPHAKVVDTELASKTTLTKSKFIEKYGEKEGIEKWDAYRNKQAYSNSFEYKQQKYGWTQQQFDEYNSNRAVTLEKCIQRHGENEGVHVWNEYVQKQAYTKTQAYFIEKYGEKIGTEKFSQVNFLKSAAVNPKTMAEVKNISVDDAVDIILNRKNMFRYTSNLEKEFVEKLEHRIGPMQHTSVNKPYGKWSTLLNSYVVFDVKHNDCVIEFNGDYWHCNPKLYESIDTGPGNKTAQEIWDRDAKKIQTARNLGFRVLTVWESDYIKNKQKIIEEVIEWMLNGQK